MRGETGELFFEISENKLKKLEANVLGKIELPSNFFQKKCLKDGLKKIDSIILPLKSRQTEYLIRDNQEVLDSLEPGSYMAFIGSSKSDIKQKKRETYNFALYWKNEAGESQFYNFWLAGRAHQKIDKGPVDYFIAFLKDYFTWPYVIGLIASGAGSH